MIKRSRYLQLLLIMVISLNLSAQNIVPNPSFEDTIQSPNGDPGVKEWQSNIGSPDYLTSFYLPPFDSLFGTPSNVRGFQVPKDGEAYFGILCYDQSRVNTREYLQTPLLQKLKINSTYKVEFWISLADSFHYAISMNDIGIAFRNSIIPNNNDHLVREIPYLNADSSWSSIDKINWQKFELTFTATDSNSVMLIGCFEEDQNINPILVGSGGSNSNMINSSFYFIDDISISEIVGIQERISISDLVSHRITDSKLQIQSAYKEKLMFDLYDLNGRIVYSGNISPHSHNEYNISQLVSQVYILNIFNHNISTTIKLLKP